MGAPTASSYVDPECQYTITGVHNGDIHVPENAYWCITDATVYGNVFANSADQLDIYETTVNGSVFVTNSSNSNIFESKVTGIIYAGNALAVNVNDTEAPLLWFYETQIGTVQRSNIAFGMWIDETGLVRVAYTKVGFLGAWLTNNREIVLTGNTGQFHCFNNTTGVC